MRILFTVDYKMTTTAIIREENLKHLLLMRGFYPIQDIINNFLIIPNVTVIERATYSDEGNIFKLEFTEGEGFLGNCSTKNRLELEYLIEDFMEFNKILDEYLRAMQSPKGMAYEMFLRNLLSLGGIMTNAFGYFQKLADGKFTVRKMPKSVNFWEKTDRMIFLEFGTGKLEVSISIKELYDTVEELYGGGTSPNIIFSEQQIKSYSRKYYEELKNDLGLMPYRMLGVVEEMAEKYGVKAMPKILKVLENIAYKLDKEYGEEGRDNALHTMGRMRMDAYLLTYLGEGGQAMDILGEGTLLGTYIWGKTDGYHKEGFIIEKNKFWGERPLKGEGLFLPNMQDAMKGAVNATIQANSAISGLIKKQQEWEEAEMQRRMLGDLSTHFMGQPFDSKTKREIEDYLNKVGMRGAEVGIDTNTGALNITQKTEGNEGE